MQRRTLLTLATFPLAACTIQRLPALQQQSMGLQSSLPAWKDPVIGQQWIYRVLNIYNSAEVDRIEETVSALNPEVVLHRRSERHGELPDENQSRWGQIRQDPAWDRTQIYQQALPLWPDPLQPNSRISLHTRYQPLGASYSQWIAVQAHVTGFERIEVEGRVWETVRVERMIRMDHEDSSRLNYTRRDTLWISPQIGRWVVRETNGEYWLTGQRPTLYREDHFRWVLERWRRSPSSAATKIATQAS